MLRKLRRRIKNKNARQFSRSPPQPGETSSSHPATRRKIKFEALETRLLLSADLAAVPQEDYQSDSAEENYLETRLTQELVIESQQQYLIVDQDDIPNTVAKSDETEAIKLASTNGQSYEEAVTQNEEIVLQTEQAQSDGDQATNTSASGIALPAEYLLIQPKQIIFVDSTVAEHEILLEEILNSSQETADINSSVGLAEVTVSDYQLQQNVNITQNSEDQQNGINLPDIDLTLNAQTDAVSDSRTEASFRLKDDTLIVVLGSQQDGIEQITEVLTAYQGVAAIHVFSHGSTANLRLGNTSLNSSKLNQYSERLKSWGQSLTPDGDVLLYGCDVANGNLGVQFVHDLSEITGADVAASNDETGSAALGGDWLLELSTGAIEAPLLIDSLSEYAHLLTLAIGTPVNDTIVLTDASLTGTTPPPPPIDFPLTEDLSIDALAGDDTIDVNGFPDTTSFYVDIDGAENSDTLDFSDITTTLTYVFNADGSISVTNDANELTATNVEIILGGSGDNNFIFSPGATFTGTITGQSAGNNTLDFNGSIAPDPVVSAYDGLLKFSGNTISNADLNITYNNIDTIDVNLSQVDISDSVDTLKTGLDNLLAWAIDLQQHEEIGKTLSGLGANVGVELGSAIDIAESFDQLRIELQKYIDSHNDITAQELQGVISAFDQDSIQYADRSIIGDEFSPTITTADSFTFIIGLTEGDITTSTPITVTGNSDLATFVENINKAINAEENLRGKISAIDVKQIDPGATPDPSDDVGRSRIGFQITSRDVDEFSLISDASGQNILGFAPSTSIADLKDELQNIGKLNVSAAGIAVELAFDGGVPELLFKFNYNADRKTDFNIDLGKGAEDLGLAFDADATLSVNSVLTAGLDLGLTLGETDTDFFFNLNSFDVAAIALLDEGPPPVPIDIDPAVGVNIGFLDAAASGTVGLQAAISAASIGRVDPTAGILPSVTATTSDLDLDLTVTVDEGKVTGLDSFNEPGKELTIDLTNGDPFEGRDLDIVYGGFDNLGKFKEFNAASFISQVGTVRDWFGSVKDSDIFKSIDIPFVTPALNGVFDLADTVGDTLLYDDGDDGVDGDTTLVGDIREALKEANLDDKIRIEGDGSKLTLIAIDSAISDIAISGAGAIGLNDSDSFDNDKRKLVASGNAPNKGVLADDITFKLTLVEKGESKDYSVTVLKDTAANNETIGNDHAKLLDENNEATFETTQDLANKLFEIIGIDENVKAAYESDDSGTKRLTFELTFSPVDYKLAVPVDFNFDLSPIGNIGTVGSPDITLGAGIDLSITLGLDLSETPAGTKPLSADTELVDLSSIDDLADAIKTEFSLSPEQVPSTTLSDADSVDITFIDSGAVMTGSPSLTFTNKKFDAVNFIDDYNFSIAGDQSDIFEEGADLSIVLTEGSETRTVTSKIVTIAYDGTKTTFTIEDNVLTTDLSSVSFASISRNVESASSWVDDGFRADQLISVTGTSSNNGSYTIATVTDREITLVASEELKTEVKSGVKVTGAAATMTENPDLNFSSDGTITRADGSWSDDGFEIDDFIVIEGAGINNGVYQIDDIVEDDDGNDGRRLELSADASLITKNNVKNVTITVPDQIKLNAGGNWTTDNFKSGQILSISGTQLNNRTSIIAGVSDDGLTLFMSPDAKVIKENLDNNSVQKDAPGLKITGGPIIRLTDDAVFSIDGEVVTVLAHPAGEGSFVSATDDNNNLLDLVSDINSALDEAGIKNKYQAELISGQILITARSELQGNPLLTFDDTANTITREEGSWLDDGFAIGQTIRLSGSSNNDDIAYTVDGISVNGAVLTLSVLEAETASRDISVIGTSPFTLTTPSFDPTYTGTDTARTELGFDTSQTADSDDLIITLTNGEVYRVKLDGTVAEPTETIQHVIDKIEGQTFGKVKVDIDPDSESGLRLVQVPALTGNPRLSFNTNHPIYDDSIAREDGKMWADDNFTAGQNIRISGADKDNDGEYTIAFISADGKYLVLNPGSLTKDQASIKDVRITLTRPPGDPFEDEIFRVEVANGSKAAVKLGILKADVSSDVDDNGKVDVEDSDGIINGDAIAGASLLDRFFIQDPKVEGNVYIRADGKTEFDKDKHGLVKVDDSNFRLNGDLSDVFELNDAFAAKLDGGAEVTSTITAIDYDPDTGFTTFTIATPVLTADLISADITRKDGITVTGDFGFVSVDLNGSGAFDTTLTMQLDDPTPDIKGITINELIKSLSHINSIVSLPTIGGPKVDGESLKFEGKAIVRTNNESWEGDFAPEEYISISGAAEQNNGHFKITKAEGSILTLDLDEDFTTETISDAKVLNEIGKIELSLDVNPDFGLIGDEDVQLAVGLFDFGNPFADTDFKKDKFDLGSDEKSFTIDGDWTDRIKPGADIVAELAAVSYDNFDLDDGNDATKLSDASFKLDGDQRTKFKLDAKVTADLGTLTGVVTSSVTSKIKTINYNETTDETTITLQDNNLTDTLTLVKVSIASKDAKTKVVSVSYDEDSKKTTVTVVDEVLTDGVNSLTVDTPRSIDYLLELPDLGNLVKFDQINISQIIDGLIELSDFLGDFEAFGFLSEPIPLINVSINDVLAFADRFDAAVQEAQNNPAGTLQVLENKLKEALGIPSGIDSDALGFFERMSSDDGILTGDALTDPKVAALKHDSVFLLSLDNGPSQLIKVVTADADTIDKLIFNVNTALSAAFATNVQARRTGDSIEFFTADDKALAISNPIDLSIYEDGDLQMFRMDFGLGIGFTKALDVEFDLGDSGILSGAADLQASGAIDFALGLGIDLNNPTDIYLFDSSITGQFEATGDDLAFRAGIGPVGVFINGGEARVGGDIGNKLFTLGLDFDGNPETREGRKLVSDISLADDFSAEFAGSITADLPVYFPAETLHKGAVVFEASLKADESGNLETTTKLGAVNPEGADIPMGDLFSFDLNELSLMDNMLLAVDGVDAFLEGLQDILDGEVFGVPLPLIGDKLSDGARFIEDLRDDFIDPFRDEIENMADQDENIVSELLFDLLGPDGIGLLLDSNDDGVITILDVVLDTNVDIADGNLDNDYMQWNILLGQTINLGTGIAFDLGIPGLGLETQGDVNVELGWSLDFGFGISFEEAFYLDIKNDGRNELEAELTVSLPDFGLSGQLAILQLDAKGNKNDAGEDLTHFTALFGVDVYNKNDTIDNIDERLAFSEFGSIGLDAGVAGEAIVDLHFELKLNSDLVPGIAGVFPKVVTDFILDWSIDADEDIDGLQLVSFSDLSTNLVKDGLQIVAFQKVSLDLGSFISDFIDPILGTVREVTEPLQPIIDFITTPLPVISDIGPDMTVLDLAEMTGKVNTGLIQSIADLITFVNAIPLDADTVLLNFGDFIIYKHDDPDLNLDITDPNADVKNEVALPKNEKPEIPDDGSNTSSFASKLKDAGDFDFPIISDPTQIFNLLLGKDAVLMTYDLKPLVAEFSYKQSFRVYGPLAVAIKGELGVIADFAFGFDTHGITQFADSGFRNPLLVFNGFYISDTDIPTGEFGTDVPELTVSGFLGVAAELNLGIASAGAGGGVGLDIFFNLFDPSHDGKVRVPEIVNSVINEFRYGSPLLAPMAMFDVSGEIYAKLFAYIEFLFFEIEFDITPEITILEFNIPFTRAPTLAEDIGDGVLQLNMGDFASQRLNNNTTDGNEKFTVRIIDDDSVEVSSRFGSNLFKQTFNGVTKVLALAGEGNDIINVTGAINYSIDFELEGGVGNDQIILGSNARGDAVIVGGVGDDVIQGGGGNDIIYGSAGLDVINGGDGNDVIFGDEGDIAYQEDETGAILVDAFGNPLVEYTRARVKVTDADDVINGSGGHDQLFGGGGEDDIQGGTGNDLIMGDGGILRDILQITARSDVSGYELTDDAVLEFIIDGKVDGKTYDSENFLMSLLAANTVGNTTIEQLVQNINDLFIAEGIDDLITAGNVEDSIKFTAAAGVLEMRVKGANDIAKDELGFTPFFKKVTVLDDTNRGQGVADTLRGNAGDDVIYGGRGDDTIYGNENDDSLFGDDGFDLVYGNGGNDRIYGGAQNDRLSGGADDDYIKGGKGHDRIWGDWMVGETPEGIAGVDSVWGGTGIDTIFGGAAGDYLFGDSDPDNIFGEEGDDTIDGGYGADFIFGGDNNDEIISSQGDDFIDGQRGSDYFIIDTMGGDMSSLVTVFDTGSAIGEGTDTLEVNGTDAADNILLRAARANAYDATLLDLNLTLADLETMLADMGVSKTLQLYIPTNLVTGESTPPPRAFVSKLNNEGNVERINYYDNLESIVVNGHAENDHIVSDNTNAAVTIHGGDGDDLFQVGQIFNSMRDADAGIDQYDEFDTVQTTKGFLSNGINAPMTINGEDGNDSFVVFRNLKVLSLNGGDGDDEFLVKAFALEGSVDDPDRDLTDITGEGGADLIQYAVNAPVGINGGDGLDTVIVLGTEFGDDFVVTEQGVYGAGLNVSFAGIEILKLDTAEGNDRIFVMGAGADHITQIFAGEGSDAFIIAGDTPPIVSQDLLGHSGIITHESLSGDDRYNNVSVDGISSNVGDDDEPFVRIIKNDGMLRITEDGTLITMYSMVLTQAPKGRVGITAIAPPPSPNEEKNGIEYLKVEKVGVAADEEQKNQLVFDASNWFIPQTFEVIAEQDLAYEGNHIAIINHLVVEMTVIDVDADGKDILGPVAAPSYHEMAIPSVNVEIIDDDLPGLVITQSDGTNHVFEGADFGAAAPFADEYTIRLNQRPDSNVTVNLINEDGQLQLEQTSLNFTPDNWDTVQTVRLIADNDSINEGFHHGYIKHEIISDQVNVQKTVTDETFDAVIEAVARSSVLLDYEPINKAAIKSVTLDGEALAVEEYSIDDKRLTILDEGQAVKVTGEIIVTYDYILPGFNNITTGTDSFTATEARSSVLLNYQPIDKDAISQVQVGAETLTADRYTIDGNRLTILDSDGQASETSDEIIVTYDFIDPRFKHVVETIGVEIGDDDAPGVLVQQSGGSTNVLESGILTSGMATGADDALSIDADFSAGDYTGLNIVITDGTGTGQTRTILANTGVTAQVDTAWDVVPDDTSQYIIVSTITPVTDSYQVVLTTQPDADVTITVSPQPTKTSARPPFQFSADNDNVAVTELAFNDLSDATISLTSGNPAPDDGQLGGDLVFYIDLTPDDGISNTTQVTLLQDDMADYESIDDLIVGINAALKDAGLEEKIFSIRDANRVVIAKVNEPQREQVFASTTSLTFTKDNWNIPQTVYVGAINDDVVDGGDIKVFAPIEQTVARIQGPLIINGAGGEGSDAGLGADPFRMPGESNDVGNVVEVPTNDDGEPLTNQVVLDGKDIDKLGPTYFKSLDTYEEGDEDDDSKAKVIIKITSGPGEGQERVIVAINDNNTFILADDWDSDDLPTNESRYIFIRELARVNEAEQVDVATVFHHESVADNTGTLTATRLFGLGMGPDIEMDGLSWPGGLTYTDLENLTIHMGRGDDHLNVYGSHNRDDFRTVTIVNTGAGDDTVEVELEAENDLVASGNVTSSRTSHFQDNVAAFPTDGRGLSGYVVQVTDADGNIQERTILYNDADTLYVDEAWENMPQAGDSYDIFRHPAGLISINTQVGDDRIDATASTAPLIVFGGLGADVLIGGEGDDILIGDRGLIDYLDDDGNIITRLGSNEIPAPQEPNPDDPDDPTIIFRQTDGVFRDPAFIKSIEPDKGGIDELHGNGGDDLLIGGAMADQLFGDAGADILLGDGGQKIPVSNNVELFETIDHFIGGNDHLDGGPGNDIMLGGFGSDVFVGNFTDDIMMGEYGRVITDNGKAISVLRLAQGSLDLGASALFSLYAPDHAAALPFPLPGEIALATTRVAEQEVTDRVSEIQVTTHQSKVKKLGELPGTDTIPIPRPEYHEVAEGDTLWRLADIYLGDHYRWTEIWQLNPQITDPDLILPGSLVKLPPEEDSADSSHRLDQSSEQNGSDQNDIDQQPQSILDYELEGETAIAAIGLVGLQSQHIRRNKKHNSPDGAFVFDEFSGFLHPYYMTEKNTEQEYKIESLEMDWINNPGLIDTQTPDLQTESTNDRPIIDWGVRIDSKVQ